MQKRILLGLLVVLGFIFTLNFVSTVSPVCGDGDCEVGESCYIDCQYEYPNVTRDPISYKSLDLTNRSLYSNRYYNSTGNYYVLEISPIPINYNNGSEFVPINTTILSENCEFDYCVRKGLYYADFKNSSTENDTVKFLYNESNISYTPLELKYVNGSDEELISNVQQVQGSANGSSFTYSGIYGSGFDLEYSYRNVLLKETLQIGSKTDLPTPTLQNPDLKLAFKFLKDDSVQDKKNNITWDEVSTLKVSGRVDIVDSENNTLFYLLSPHAVDDNNSILKLNYTFENIGGDLIVSVSVPYSWLSNESRVYPISIDPSSAIVYLDAEIHGWVLRAMPQNAFDFFSNDDFAFFYAGIDHVGDHHIRHRSYLLWLGEIFANLNSTNTVLNVDLAWNVIDGDIGPGIGNNIKFWLMDPTIPGNILLPDTQEEMAVLYDLINDPPRVGIDPVTGLGSYTTPLDPLVNTELEDRGAGGNNSFPFIIGVEGSCCQPDHGYVVIDGVGAANSPFLIVEIEEPPPPPVCGNGIIEGEEQCDGEDLGGTTCQDLGFSGGTLGCVPAGNPNECTFDTSQCTEFDPLCHGIIGAITEDSSGNPMENLYVYLNSVNKGQTDSLGYKELTLNDVTCGDPQEVQIKCTDDSTVCDTQSTSMDSTDPNNPDYDSLYFTCDMCLPAYEDLFIEPDDIAFADQGDDLNVSVTVHTVNIEASNVEVNITRLCGDDYFTDTETIPTVTSSNDYIVSIVRNLDGCQKIRAHVDPNDDIDEGDNEENNEAEQFVIDPLDVYVNVNTGYSLVDDKIEDFIDDFAQPVSQGNAQLEIFVGRTLAPPVEADGWGLENNVIFYNGFQEGIPYNGIVGKRFDGQNNKPRLYVFGNEIDGTAAAVRRLIKERAGYLNENHLNEQQEPTYLNRTNLDAISVFDYLHTDENQADYRQNNAGFAETIDNVLRQQTFTLAIKRVQTSNDATVLRLKNINQELSPAFRDFTNERPVVLANQLFGNLFSMEGLGLKIARDEKFNELFIRDAWLAEMTGGPNTDCDLCPNYDFDDLIDFYWPALIGGVIQYTGEPQVDYVGYSSSGGVGIKSFDKYVGGKSGAGLYINDAGDWIPFNLPANSVDHMALIAPMGAFDGTTVFTFVVNQCGDEILGELSGNDHISLEEIRDAGIRSCPFYISEILEGIRDKFSGESDISYNLLQDIFNDVQDDSNENPALSSIDRLLIIYGRPNYWFNDGVVPMEDINYMYSNSNATEKKYKARILKFHIDMHNFPSSYDPLIAKFLNNQLYLDDEEEDYDIEEG